MYVRISKPWNNFEFLGKICDPYLAFFLYCNRINMQYMHWRMQKKVYLKFKFVQGQVRGHLKADKATVLFTIRHTGYIYTYTGISISNLIRTNVKVLYSTPPPPPFLLGKYWYPMH